LASFVQLQSSPSHVSFWPFSHLISFYPLFIVLYLGSTIADLVEVTESVCRPLSHLRLSSLSSSLVFPFRGDSVLVVFFSRKFGSLSSLWVVDASSPFPQQRVEAPRPFLGASPFLGSASLFFPQSTSSAELDSGFWEPIEGPSRSLPWLPPIVDRDELRDTLPPARSSSPYAVFLSTSSRFLLTDGPSFSHGPWL